MYASYAASNRITESVARAHATQRSSCARVATVPVGLLGEHRYARSTGTRRRLGLEAVRRGADEVDEPG